MSMSSVMPKNTTARGELSEWEIALALARTGKNVLRPLSAGLRYDLAIDNGDGSITRVQCKTGILRNGVILFRTYNADGRRPHGVRYFGQVDAFGVLPSDAARLSRAAVCPCNERHGVSSRRLPAQWASTKDSLRVDLRDLRTERGGSD